ncbi:UDP-glucuronate 4-epimerase [Paenibacillus phyllosphaerae]|uniref:UDP-glucuronate 4-epimerase n=1 Tax=Paenibacillus phyllosphaerae TaxID=274593 RepID=A0A7W5AU93_9BACL|nr:UDP-glucuronate 4-epimerase [Paenibacillus phyllosphaerae]
MATYLITGGAGFIGSHLSYALLQQGHRVINVDVFTDLYDYRAKIRNVLAATGCKSVFDFRYKEADLRRLSELVRSADYRLEVADIRDREALARICAQERIEAVVHLAALPGVRASGLQPLLFQEVNVDGTLQILETMRDHGIGKWVCASSSSVYGNSSKAPFNESAPVDAPISVYAATKKSCELLGYTYHHLYGIDTVMLRFFTVFGERQRPDLAIHKFVRLMEQDEPIPFFGDGETMRDYTYIGDIIDGTLRALNYVEGRSGVYEIINLGGSAPITLRRMVELLEEKLGRKAVLDRLPKQPGDVERTDADIAKAEKLLGYAPKTSFESGLERFIAWYKGGQVQ